MRALPTLLLALVCLLAFSVEAKSRKSNHYKPTAADDHPVQPEPKASTKSSAKAESSSKSSTTKSESSGKKHAQTKSEPASHKSNNDVEFSIEDVDEDKIDQILRDTSKNLVVFFYDGRVKCPTCGDALSEMEEIDDDVESTGYIEVVKTDDRRETSKTPRLSGVGFVHTMKSQHGNSLTLILSRERIRFHRMKAAWIGS
ncbi:Thioredoxin domain-containing protein [Aphelenchoides bicaudatus]|nr:Thioredoxin domain-containing protein [Aphelenchoides bicaudatus]